MKDYGIHIIKWMIIQENDKMNELIICIGISGAGKSTWVKEFTKENLNYLRINRDDIRKTIVGDLKGYYKRPDIRGLEKIVSDVEEQLLLNYTMLNKSVILDNTNLNEQVLNKWIENSQKIKYDIKFKLFDCDLHIAKTRVLWRDDLLWEEIKYIEKQYELYQSIKKWILNNYKEYII